jgi:hypothetical protein
MLTLWWLFRPFHAWKIFLPDVNIWIALTSNRHVHHSLATQWLQGIENNQIAFCRISELSFLCLLTNAHVMGKDVLSPVEAWLVYDEWLIRIAVGTHITMRPPHRAGTCGFPAYGSHPTLTTTALYRSSSGWFETCS